MAPNEFYECILHPTPLVITLQGILQPWSECMTGFTFQVRILSKAFGSRSLSSLIVFNSKNTAVFRDVIFTPLQILSFHFKILQSERGAHTVGVDQEQHPLLLWVEMERIRVVAKVTALHLHSHGCQRLKGLKPLKHLLASSSILHVVKVLKAKETERKRERERERAAGGM